MIVIRNYDGQSSGIMFMFISRFAMHDNANVYGAYDNASANHNAYDNANIYGANVYLILLTFIIFMFLTIYKKYSVVDKKKKIWDNFAQASTSIIPIRKYKSRKSRKILDKNI